MADPTGGVASNTGVVAGSVGATGNSTAAGLSSDSHGVIGIRYVRLSAGADSSTQGAVLISGSSNVHLDGGTRMIVRVSAQ